MVTSNKHDLENAEHVINNITNYIKTDKSHRNKLHENRHIPNRISTISTHLVEP